MKTKSRLLMVSALALLGSCTASQSGPVTVQGWTPDQQARWYAATQGSRLMPLAWMRALERADSDQPFLADDNLQRFGLLRQSEGDLPIGFVIDDNDDKDLSVSKLRWFQGQGGKEHWIGLNCSACHTAQLEYQGKPLRIDGGPSLFDYQSFIEGLDAALVATKADPAKWRRFSKAVLGDRDTDANRALLGAAVDRLIDWERRVEALNSTPLRYGNGRVDAFGHIYNKVALFSGAARPTPNPADAPVSYPFLWDIYRHDKLQYNGIASNQRLPLGGSRYLDYGALGRNSGEVIGVFGDVIVTPNAGLTGYRSSLWADNLVRLETQLALLRAPAWPSALFGTPDAAKVAQGKTVYDAHCKSCHTVEPGTAPYKVVMVPLKQGDVNATDPWMACNAISYRSATGRLEGTPKNYLGSGERFGPDAPLAEMLEATVKGALAGKKGQIVAQTGRVFFGAGGAPRVVTEEAPDMRPLRLDACYAAQSPYMAYKARPLDGIWATAPYLHNGSVPTLYDLLKPAAQRPASFAVGTRQYDPVRIGYVTDASAPGNRFTFNTRGPGGQMQPGNSNEGHDYGAARMSEAERLALLEYLKTL